jgi:formylglycine-generating enzyme required for sulfatase activity
VRIALARDQAELVSVRRDESGAGTVQDAVPDQAAVAFLGYAIPMADDKKYSPKEMDEILGRALERSKEPTGVDREIMEEAAREVGISPEALDAAARELEGEKRRRSQRRSLFVGAVLVVVGTVSLAVHYLRAANAAIAAPTSCPADMVGIMGGTYTLGERHDTETIRPYCLDRTEVTVGAYGACVSAGHCTEPDPYEATRGKYRIDCTWRRPGREQHPLNCVDWGQAASYCESRGKRLPTEEEWEWAARNGPAATIYPWGNGPPDAQHVNACGAECPPGKLANGYAAGSALYPGDDGFTDTAPVGSFPKGDNQWGVHDLAGNIREWTATYLDSKAGTRVARGGAWDENIGASLSAADRSYARIPSYRSHALGFRCAL